MVLEEADDEGDDDAEKDGGAEMMTRCFGEQFLPSSLPLWRCGAVQQHGEFLGRRESWRLCVASFEEEGGNGWHAFL